LNIIRYAIIISLISIMAIASAVGAPFTLQVYGNANMDQTINSEDITYLEKEIKGDLSATKFSDANGDGVVDPKDIDQVQAIINGSEKFIVVLDDTGSTVKIPEPVKSFVYHGHNSYVYETLRAIGVSDRIVGITDRFTKPGGNRYSETYFPELTKVTSVGDLQSVNYEVVNNLHPGLVLSDAKEYYDASKTPDTPVVALDVNITNFKEANMRYGYIFEKVPEAQEYVDWYSAQEKKIQDRVEKIPESQRPLVYVSSYNVDTTKFQVPARDNYRGVMVTDAGGKYIGDELSGAGILDVDAEWVITRNPAVIIFSAGNSVLGYDIKDPKNVTDAINEFLARPEFKDVDAVKNKRVYMVSHPYILCGGASGLIGSLYYAKWLYPDQFKDMDVEALHQEFVSKFQHLDIKVKDSLSAYPKPA
jgi:iron complex transport system substrate-binding protein